jgi:hypothetical protein
VISFKELRFIDANALKIIRLLGLLPPLQRPKKALLFTGLVEHKGTLPQVIKAGRLNLVRLCDWFCPPLDPKKFH